MSASAVAGQFVADCVLDYVDNSGFLPSSAPWNLSCGLDQSDSESNIESWLIRSGLLSSVELWFWLLVHSVSLVFHADVLLSVCLFASGSVEFIVYAAAMLFADAFSFVCRDFVGFALSGAALPCWQRCLSPTSNSLDEASCALFPGCNKGKVKGSIKIGSSSSFPISHLVFPFR